jgi:hypothetical protein
VIAHLVHCFSAPFVGSAIPGLPTAVLPPEPKASVEWTMAHLRSLRVLMPNSAITREE